MPACMFFPYGYLDLSLPQKHFHHGFDIFRRHIAWYGVGRRRYQSAFQKRVKQCAGDSFDFIRRFMSFTDSGVNKNDVILEKNLPTLIQTNETYESTQIDAFFESKPKIDAFLKIDANAQRQEYKMAS